MIGWQVVVVVIAWVVVAVVQCMTREQAYQEVEGALEEVAARQVPGQPLLEQLGFPERLAARQMPGQPILLEPSSLLAPRATAQEQTFAKAALISS